MEQPRQSWQRRAQRDNSYKDTLSKKVQEMAYFTFEKQEKGKTKPQFLLKTVRKGSEKIDFLLILKK